MSRATQKYAVDRSRVTWVLAALVASMTIGTVVLGVLEPSKILRSDKAAYLAATWNTESSTKITSTAVPIKSGLWQSVVIHAIHNTYSDDLVLRCLSGKNGTTAAHFAVSQDATILIGSRWANQEPAERYPGKILIGIHLPEGQTEATLAQAQAMVALIRDLQVRCNIPPSKIYLHSQLSSRSCTSNPLHKFNWRQALWP
jgi:hypothetical protein